MNWIWLGVVISLLLIEYMSRNFTAICFAISGIVSFVMTYFVEKYNIQLAVFLALGIFLILVIRPFVIKKLCAHDITLGKWLVEKKPDIKEEERSLSSKLEMRPQEKKQEITRKKKKKR